MVDFRERDMALHPTEVVERLARATSAHDLEGIVACFGEGYVNQTPTHPLRSFAGRDQVRRNWEQILTGVPDITARVLATAVAGDTVWSEWQMSGTRLDGALHEMRGVIIFEVAGELVQAARFYLEPLERESGTVDDAVHRTLTAPRAPGSTP
jgi:ketosteroid isomerase-like protein